MISRRLSLSPSAYSSLSVCPPECRLPPRRSRCSLTRLSQVFPLLTFTSTTSLGPAAPPWNTCSILRDHGLQMNPMCVWRPYLYLPQSAGLSCRYTTAEGQGQKSDFLAPCHHGSCENSCGLSAFITASFSAVRRPFTLPRVSSRDGRTFFPLSSGHRLMGSLLSRRSQNSSYSPTLLPPANQQVAVHRFLF